MRCLLNESVQAGNNEIIWQGWDDRDRQVASGVYFYRLEEGNFQETRSMALLK